jgi:hypothetical protein
MLWKLLETIKNDPQFQIKVTCEYERNIQTFIITDKQAQLSVVYVTSVLTEC